MKKNIPLFLKGIAIGISNIIPGVSGGTLAVVLGIYDQLISALNQFISDKENRQKAFFFLLPVGLGAVCGILALSKLLSYLLSNYEQPVLFLFMGLIIGSIPLLINKLEDKKPSPVKVLLFLISFIGLAVLSLLQPDKVAEIHVDLNPLSVFHMFISGFIASITMIVPGISGSFMLLLLGSYHIILEAVSSFNFIIVGIVCTGALFGFLSTTKALDYLLKNFPGHMTYFILGLLCGSIFAIWPGIQFTWMSLVSVIILVAGYVATQKLS